jgi:hypothetical protein
VLVKKLALSNLQPGEFMILCRVLQKGGVALMPLTMARPGETVTIRKITGKDEVRQHLAELGFVVDGTVTVVSEIAGNLILQVKDSRIALDKSMANRVMI